MPLNLEMPNLEIILSNLEIMLEDITGESNFQSLTMLVFYNSLPDDLESELRSDFAADGTYSISINSHDLKAGKYYAMVRCSSTAVDYRIVPVMTPATIGSHGVQGFVCGSSWAYHAVTTGQVSDAAAASSGGGANRRQLGSSTSTGNTTINARFSLILHTGDAHYLTRHSYAPLKLVPPYGHADASSGTTNLDVCNIHEGEVVYIGLKGGAECRDVCCTIYVQ